MWQDRSGRIQYSIRQRRANIPVYYRSIMTRGHIATKTLDFEKRLQSQMVCRSFGHLVDHGTAFDIAGKGIVSAVSMIEAIRLAAKYAPNFTGKHEKKIKKQNERNWAGKNCRNKKKERT